MLTEVNTSRRIVVLLALLAVLPYLNALGAGFTLDDEPNIRTNAAVIGGIDPIRILASPLYPGDLYRPFTALTFAVNERLTPGAAAPFHAVNIVLHAAVTALVFQLGLRLFASARIGTVAAALFAVHPIHTEAVTSLVGRTELLAALFGLLALLSAAQLDRATSRRARAAMEAASLTCFSLAVLSKESGLTVLVLIPLFRMACRGDALGRGASKELRSLDWVPYALCAGMWLALRTYVVGAIAPPQTVTPLENMLAFVPWTLRVRSAMGVLWDYFGLLNAPLNLAADYSTAQVPVVTSWLDPRVLAGTAMVAGAGAVFVRQRHPAVAFAAILPLAALALTANVLFPIGTVKAERLLYLPSIGWVLVVAYVFDRLVRLPRYRAVAAGALAAVVAAYGARTWTRNWDWRDNLALHQSMARTAPNSAKSRYNFGVALQQQDAQEAAVAQFRRALAIYPWAEGAALGIGIAFEKRGYPDAAVDWYKRALAIMPEFDKAHTNLCHVLFDSRRFAAAGDACRNGLRYAPADANLLKGLGVSLVNTGETERGLAVLRRSLALNQHDQELRTYVERLEQYDAAPGTEGVAVQ
jgi:tetratricopeptide (TPR) repeat protein